MARPHSTVTLELVRCTTESNVCRPKDCLVYSMIYVHDLLLIGVQSMVNTLFSRTQKEVLLRHTGDLNVGSKIDFFGRTSALTTTMWASGMTTCNPAPSRGVPRMKGTAEDEVPLDHEQHKQYRQLVGKTQWLAYTRPDICYGAKELERSLQAPTQLDNNKLKAHATQPATKGANKRHLHRCQLGIV